MDDNREAKKGWDNRILMRGRTGRGTQEGMSNGAHRPKRQQGVVEGIVDFIRNPI